MRQRLGYLAGLLAVILCLAPGLVFSASQELAAKQVWRWGHHTSDLNTLDPAFSVEDMTYSAGDAVFNGLVRLKPGTLDFDNLEGDLAESWEISKDGLVYTFRCSIHLRSPEKLQTGIPLWREVSHH